MLIPAIAGDQLSAADLSKIAEVSGLYAADTGSSTAYAIAPTPNAGSYVTGMEFTFLAAHANTTSAPTLNVNGLGTKTIINVDGSPLLIGQIFVNGMVRVKYDGTNFQLITPVKVRAPSLGFQRTTFLTTSTLYGSMASTAEPDGSVIYVIAGAPATGPMQITRWQRNAITGIYFQTHTLQTTVQYTNTFGVVVTSAFLYIIVGIGSNVSTITRFSKADLTGETSQTVAGTTTAGNQLGGCWSDGTNIYVWVSGDTFRQWTLSGSTWTGAGSTITYTGCGSITTPAAAVSDGTFVWLGAQASTSQINKYPVAGGAALATSPTFLGQSFLMNGLILMEPLILGVVSSLDVFNATVKIRTDIEIKGIVV